MINILIAVPTFENISPDTFRSIYNLEVPENVKTCFEFVRGYDCARARNKIINIALDNEYDYILMVDSDIVLPKKTLVYAIEGNPDFILGVYPRKSEPTKTEIFNDTKYDFAPSSRWSISELKNFPSTRIEIKGGGFGCAFIKTSMLEKMKYPYFNYVNYEDGDFLSEDLYFCVNAKNNGFKIYVDTRILCSHINKTILSC